MRTVQSYSRMPQNFFVRDGKTPDRPRCIAWVIRQRPFRQKAWLNYDRARIACLSSFLCFLIRMDVIAANPCDAIEPTARRAEHSKGPERRTDPASLGVVSRLLSRSATAQSS